MNQAPGQGPAGRPNVQNAQPAGAPNRPQGPPLYRPETMRTITFLGEDEKVKYEKGLASLWKVHDSAPPGSAAQEEAKNKIAEFGKILLMKVNQRRQQLQQQQQQQSQQGQQQHQQVPQQNQQPPQQQQRPQQPLQQPGQGQTAAGQGGAGPSANLAGAGSQAPAPGTQASPPNMVAPAAQPRPLPSHIISHINELQFQAPPNVADKAKWIEDIKGRYAKALYSMESARNATKAIEQTLQDNQALPPEERKKLEERRALVQKQYGDAITFANLVRSKYVSGANQRPAANGAAAGPGTSSQARPQTSGMAGAAAQPGQGINNGAPGAGPASSMQSTAATVNAAFEAAKKQQLAAGRLQGAVTSLPPQAQGTPAQPQVQQAPATPAQAQHSPVAQPTPAQQPHQQAQQQPPVTAHRQPVPPSQQPQQPGPPIKIEPGTQPLPAPLNTAIAAAAGAGGLPSAGTPTHNSARLQTPQSATPTTTNANIRPLTHAAAVNLASQPRPPASVPVPPATGAASSLSTNPPMVATAQHQGHTHAHPSQPTHPSQQSQPAHQPQPPQPLQPPQPAAQNLQSKLPIPKVLPEKAAQMPTPVPTIGGVGAGRPTYGAGGVMNQPALPKTPAYQLEGEGERILNKKKLDELVRQVCGGTAEGQEGNLLTPEVEESVLNMADAFVDNVLGQACRNAKERGSKVLEIRDIQLVLERTYNIRIPGYSSEELRTVRKVQPNSSWIKKMSAVQAAKVVPGKGDS